MNVLVLNSGSSSLKYKLFAMGDNGEPAVLAAGLAERIGEPGSRLAHILDPGGPGEIKEVREEPLADHAAALHLAIGLLVAEGVGAVGSTEDIHAVGHRVVHGGETFSRPVLVDDAVLDAIRAVEPLAPLHNPANRTGIQAALGLFPGAPQVAVFDTAFFANMGRESFLYPLPYELYAELGLRKYGFHGTSHRFVSRAAARMLNLRPDDASVITAHLGNGCSMAAVRQGRAVDTSLGLTPMAGLMMGTRCGDIDPAIPAFLARSKGLDIAAVDKVLNGQSGLKGICGVNDMRDVHALREKGDERAELALDMFAYRVKRFIGAYLAVVGPCHAVAFTAGIGENDPEVRARCVAGLEHLGLVLDPARNLAAVRGRAGDIAAPESTIRILVVPTNEELEIARQTVEVVGLLAETESVCGPVPVPGTHAEPGRTQGRTSGQAAHSAAS